MIVSYKALIKSCKRQNEMYFTRKWYNVHRAYIVTDVYVMCYIIKIVMTKFIV
jgi:hypothetical protein